MMRHPPPRQLCAGLRVVDLTQGMPGPMAGMILADNGADVVKVEPPGGDWARGRLRGFHMWNRGKRSIAIDLTAAAGYAELTALVAEADVVLTDAAPSVAGKLGVDRSGVTAMNPEVIHCHLGVWGGVRPDDSPVYEGVLSAATGRMAKLDLLSGKIRHARRVDPTFNLPPTASYGTALLAVQGILAALVDRAGGQPGGAHVETSLLQGAMAFLMRQELARPVPTEHLSERDLMHRGIELCFLTPECADGRYIQMCARQDHHFRSWLRALELEHLLEEPRFSGAPMRIASFADVDELEQLLRERMRTRTQREWMELFTTHHDVGADPFLTPEEFLAHPQMVENGRVATVHDPDLGLTTQVGALVVVDDSAPTTFAPAPGLDEHGAELRDHLGSLPPRAPRPESTVAVQPGARRRPLEGITILEVAYFIAGPLGTALLAELGARVIKVEPLDGDPYRRTGLQATKFLHGKESIAVDLKDPRGTEVLHALIRSSNALVHSFRPGVPERLGLDEPTARALNPDLVYLNAASYGSHGPEARRIAFHSTPTALTGAGIAQAGRGNAPVDDSFPDPAAGIGAGTALLLGLLEQRRTGAGSSLETTMLTSTAYVMSNDLVMADGTTEASIADTEQLGTCALYRLYECADGWLFLAAVTDREWDGVARSLSITDSRFHDRAGRRAHDGLLAACIADWCAQGTTAHRVEALTANGVPATVVELDGIEAWLEREGALRPADHPAFEPYYRLPPKVTVSGADPVTAPACATGEHTVPLLRELGWSDDAVQALLAAGIVAEWQAE